MTHSTARRLGNDISDAPPIFLEWTLGTDMPVAQKDGVGCWLTAADAFVVAGGLWNPTNGALPGLAAGRRVAVPRAY